MESIRAKITDYYKLRRHTFGQREPSTVSTSEVMCGFQLRDKVQTARLREGDMCELSAVVGRVNAPQDMEVMSALSLSAAVSKIQWRRPIASPFC
jgi:hypothetical protein